MTSRWITALAVLALASAAHAAYFVRPTALSPVTYAPTGLPARASVAANGRGFAAIWRTTRDQRFSTIAVDANGAPRVSIGVRIAEWGASQPVIAGTSTGYVVALNRDQRLEVRFLDDAGRPDGEPIVIDAAGMGPRIAVNGDRVAILHYPLNRFELILTLLSRTNRASRRDVIVGSGGGYPDQTYDVAASESGYAVINGTRNGVKLSTWDVAGQRLASFGLEPSPENSARTSAVAAASDGRSYVVMSTGLDGTLHATSIDGTSIVPMPVGATIDPAKQILDVALAFDGQRYVGELTTGTGDRRVAFRGEAIAFAFDATTPRAVTVPLDSGPAGSPSAAGANGVSLLAWAAAADDQRGGEGEARAEIMTSSTTSAAFPLAIAAPDQLAATATSNGVSTLIAWTEVVARHASGRAGILDAASVWHELGPIVDPIRASTRLVVASDGNGFLVAWPGGAVRLGPNGERGDVVPLSLPATFVPTNAAWNGHRYLIAGTDAAPGQRAALSVVPVDDSGAGPLKQVRRANAEVLSDPRIAVIGSDILMTFIGVAQPPCGDQCAVPDEPYAMYLTAGLEPSAAFRIAPDDVAVATAIASNGNAALALVVNYWSLDGAFIDRMFGPQRPHLIWNAGVFNRLGRPSIAPTGSDFLVAIRSDRNAIYAPDQPFADNHYLLTVHPDGSASPPERIDEAFATSDVTLLFSAGRPLLIESQSLIDAPWYGASRVVVYGLPSLPHGRAAR